MAPAPPAFHSGYTVALAGAVQYTVAPAGAVSNFVASAGELKYTVAPVGTVLKKWSLQVQYNTQGRLRTKDQK